MTVRNIKHRVNPVPTKLTKVDWENTETHEITVPVVNGDVIRQTTKITEVLLESATDLKHTQGTDTALGTLGTKNPVIDADLVISRNSASTWALVTSTWTQIKAFLKTYFDTIYAAVSHSATHTNGTDDIQNATAAQKGLATSAQITKLDGIEAGADVTDATNVAAAGAVMESDYTAKGDILGTSAANTPDALHLGTDGQVLTVHTDHGNGLGIEWAAAPGGGDFKADGSVPLTGDIDFAGTQQCHDLQTPAANGEAIRQTAKITEVLLESATDLKHTQGTDIIIKDADADTKIQVEESADEDIIRMDTAGVERFNLDAAGIMTITKQPYIYIDSALGQSISDVLVGYPVILFNNENTDEQNEFDSSVKSGTATATSANHLVDTTANQFTAGDVGKTVWNTTDNTYASITVVNSVSDVTLSANIMANGEAYKIYFSRYTAKVAGKYLVFTFIQMNGNTTDGKYTQIYITKNANTVATQILYASAASTYMGVQLVGIVSLAVNDYINIIATQNTGVVKALGDWASGCYLQIIKIT
jgi:hypothetical protein